MAKKDKKEREDVSVNLVTHLINILLSIFSKVEVYIISQQSYISNELHAQKLHFSITSEGAISEYERDLHSEGFD